MSEVLNWQDRIELLPHVAARLGSTLWTVAAYRLGHRGPYLPGEVDCDPPTTTWAMRADTRARTTLGDEFYNHWLRAWCFGIALARADKANDLDPKLLYVAAMLHDIGLQEPVADRCFTHAGALAAKQTAPADTPLEDVERVQSAIVAHADIRRPSEPLSRYLQEGSLLDVAGTRITKLDPGTLSQACLRWSRTGFPGSCRTLWREECRRFPQGRAAYARCPGGLLLGTRLNPLPR